MEQMRTLYIYELKKIACRKMVCVTAGIMVIFCIFMSFAKLIGMTYSYSDDGSEEEISISGYERMKIERKYARELSGRKIDDELLREMQEHYRDNTGVKEELSRKINLETGDLTVVETGGGEAGEDVDTWENMLDKQKYMPVYSYVQWIMEDAEEADAADAAGLYYQRERLVADSRGDQMLTEKELEYWKKQDAGLEVPFTYAYMDGWKYIWDQANIIQCMLLLLLCISLSGVFSVEHQRRMDAMILCSQNGKRKLYFVKILAGVTFGSASAMLLFGAGAISNLVIYGADGFTGALQIAFPLSSWKVSIGGSLLVLCFLVLAISVLYSIVIMFLSEWLRKSVGVMAIPVSIMIITLFVDIPYRFKPISQIYDLLPTNLLMRQALWDDRLFSVLGKYLTNFQIAPMVYILAAVIVFLMGKRVYERYQVGA